MKGDIMLKANFGFVVIEVMENKDVSPGGIVIPTRAVEPSGKGKIYDIPTYDNDDEEDETDALAVGTIVYFPPYSGNEIIYDGKKLLAIKEDQILAFELEDNDE